MGGARRWCALAIGLVAALMLAGCTAPVSGSAVAQRGSGGTAQPRTGSPTSSAPRETTARGLLGDLTTIDPCSLTDPDEFTEFGTPELAPRESLDECQVKIKTSGSEPIDLYVGNLDRTESYPDLPGKKSTEVLDGRLKLVDYSVDSNTYCTQLLVFADGVTLSVTGSATAEEPKLCEIVRTGMDRVLAAMEDGDVEHLRFGSNSLGRLDPCAVAPESAVAAVPGLGSVEPKSYPAKHSCSWAARDNSVRVRLIFAVGAPPRPVGEGAAERPIADRPSVVSPTPRAGGYSFCGVHTGHVPFTATDQSEIVELATIFVRMKEGQVDAACAAATELAGAVWPELPRP